MEKHKILVINPGSTSTKIAVFENETCKYSNTIKHSCDNLREFHKVTDQHEFRMSIILEELKLAGVDISDVHAIIGRGGLVKPVESGVYEVNEALRNDLTQGRTGDHASNLGGIIAWEIAQKIKNIKSYIADPVIVDELQDVARITGHPLFHNRSVFHALNQKAVARHYAKLVGKNYEELNIIVAHMGGGISVGAHKQGKVIDVNNALDGDGPFSPERSGSLPVGDLVKLCFSGEYTLKQVMKMINGDGGLAAYTGLNDVLQLSFKARAGDKQVQLLLDAMAYSVGKAIGAKACVLNGNVDAIILTGGISKNEEIVSYITKMVSFIAPVFIHPGEAEMEALAMNAYMVLTGEVIPKVYK